MRASEALYRSIMSASPDDIGIADLEGRVRMVSPAGVTMFGYGCEEELVGRALVEFLAPEDRERARADIARLHARIVELFEARMEEAVLFFPYAEGKRVAEAHAEARVLEETYDEAGTHLRVRAPHDVLARLRREA